MHMQQSHLESVIGIRICLTVVLMAAQLEDRQRNEGDE